MGQESKSKWLILIEEKEAVVGMLTESGNLFVSDQKGWDGSDPNSLVASLDSGIGSCLAKEDGLPRPKRTIFILPPFWINHRGEVLSTHKKTLEYVCKQLNLDPEGFLVGEEVLANFYENFVSIYFGSQYLRFSVIKEKSVEVQEELENGEDIDPQDVAVFLRQLNGKAMVPQQLVFWGRIKEGNKDRLLSYNWQKEKLFDSTPKLKALAWPEFFELFAQIVQGEVKLEVVEAPNQISEVPSENGSGLKKEEPESTFGFSSQDVAARKGWQAEIEEEKEPKSKPEPEPEPKPKLKPEKKKLRLPKIKLPAVKLPKVKLRLRLLAIPLVLIGGLFLSWRFSKARVEIYVTPKELSEELQVKLAPEAKSLDLDKGIIPVDEVGVEKSESKDRAATGDKLIGEKATGEVKLFNRTAERAEFEAGTSLFGPGDLEFVLDNDVSVASKTADLSTGVDRWGETVASVTAGDIGAEYNSAADSLFSIGEYSDDDYLAKNPEPFSGGTSRKIRAVSEADQESLIDSLSEDLMSLAEKELKSKLSDSQIIDGSFTATVVDEEFSAQVGEEAENISLDLTVKVTAAKISQEKLLKIAEEILVEELESGYEVKEGSLMAKLDVDEDSEKDSLTGKLTLKGKAYPKIDKEELRQKLVRKKESRAKKLTREAYPRIYRLKIFYQLLPLRYFSYLPPKPENIIISVKE